MIAFLRARLCERSTWGDIIVGVVAAAALPWPWSLICALCALVKAIIPDNLPKE